MSIFCVSCGAEHTGTQPRCSACYSKFKTAGGLVRTEETHGRLPGIRVTNVVYRSAAPVKYCRECRGFMHGETARQWYANKNGRECFTCTPCHQKKRYGLA
jgi:hypothetical protein